jgi:hypothetical protein
MRAMLAASSRGRSSPVTMGMQPWEGYMDLCVTMDNIRGKRRMILHKRKKKMMWRDDL